MAYYKWLHTYILPELCEKTAYVASICVKPISTSRPTKQTRNEGSNTEEEAWKRSRGYYGANKLS